MGKRLLQQRRGRSPRFTAKPIRSRAEVRHSPIMREIDPKSEVLDIVHCPAHSAPLALISSGADRKYILAPEGVGVGDSIGSGNLMLGSVHALADLPEGTMVHNIELKPGDGGKIVRSSGTAARIMTKTEVGVILQLPSKKNRLFNSGCRASVGVVAGGGRLEKPLLKAGKNYHKFRSRAKSYPRVSGVSMNAVAHPFGGKGSHSKGRPTQSARNDPPGRKVGKIAPRRTGRKKR